MRKTAPETVHAGNDRPRREAARGTRREDDTPVDDKAIALRINGKAYSFAGDADMPLLWYLRDVLQMTGTKFGCGIGACGACTVLVDGKAQRACLTPMKAAAKHDITTIEGLAGAELHPLQQAWIEIDVAQCGYCQAGQIMAAADLLRRNCEPERRRHRQDCEPLPLRHVSAHSQGDQARRRDHERERRPRERQEVKRRAK